MFEVTKSFIDQCALTLGQYDSDSVNALVTLFHDQHACSQFISATGNVQRKFEQLLFDQTGDDTPLIRVELAIMVRFKQVHLSTTVTNHELNGPVASNTFPEPLSIDDELTIAYCFLLAKIDDRLSVEHLRQLKFLLKVRLEIQSLFDLYRALDQNIAQFFVLLIQCGYFKDRLCIAHTLIQEFERFIIKYRDFLESFGKCPKIQTNMNGTGVIQTDAALNRPDAKQIRLPQNANREEDKAPAPVKQVSASSVSQGSTPPQTSALSVPQRGLCVIINIVAFNSPQYTDTPKRSGSEKDVNLIEMIFNKLNFTVLNCKKDFTLANLELALNHINDKDQFGHFDCLVMFIMSHGLLHSFFTTDGREVIIRDIVRRFADSSTTSIWSGKSRLFFIQACRSLLPNTDGAIRHHDRDDIKSNDLSPRMLVAYSCSPTETSKRSPLRGSIFVQLLCIMLLRFSNSLPIQRILEWTTIFVVTHDKHAINFRKTMEPNQPPLSIQRPQFIEREFSPTFRFSKYCLNERYRTWNKAEQTMLEIPMAIWELLNDLVNEKVKNRTALNE